MTNSECASRRTLTLPADSIDFRPNTMVGSYKIDSMMFEGSQTTLFRVHDRASTPYVMRVYFDGCTPKKKLTDSLLNSRDEKVCKIISAGTHAGHDYDIVPVLKPIPDIRMLSEREQIKLIENEAEAIKAFHKTGFCHRDIKREHFMVSDNGNIVLVDIASALENGSVAIQLPSQFLPRDAYTGTVRPEDDLFSFGVAILEQFLPMWLDGKTRSQIIECLFSSRELEQAIAQIPSFFRNSVRKLLSDNPDSRSECEWFRKGRAPIPQANVIHQDNRNAVQLTKLVRQELLAVAVYCNPEVFNATVRKAAKRIDFFDSNSLTSFLTFLQNIPKAREEKNYTTLNESNVISALNERVITDQSCLSRNDPIRTLHKFERNNILYIFDMQLINELDRRGSQISEQKEKRALAILKAIGIIIGVLACIAAAIAVIIIVLYVLFYIIAMIVVIGVICAIINGS